MTLAAVVAGENSATTSATTTLCQVDVDCAVGDMLVVCIAADNEGTSGASSISSVADNKSNTYAVGALRNKGNATSPHDSGTCAVFYSRLTVALVVGDYVTVSFSPATVSKAVVLWKVTSGTGTYSLPAPKTDDGYGVQAGWSGFSVTAGDMIIGVCAFESADSSIGRDTDTQHGTWSNPIHSITANKSGVHSASQVVSSQWKVPSTTGTQQFANTVSASADWESVGFVIREDPAPPVVGVTMTADLATLTATMTATGGTAVPFDVEMVAPTTALTATMYATLTRGSGAYSFGSVTETHGSEIDILAVS